MKYIAALDQGTTSSRAILFDSEQNIVELSQKEFTQHYPRAGWVEHDPMEIFSSQYAVLTEALMGSGVDLADVAAIGITNQRETTVVWDRETGLPVCNAIVWQCRRTADICERILADSELTEYVRSATGLLPDAYFSATKIMWILENVEGAREKAEDGRLMFGTVDSWLIYKMTGGKRHVTDRTNASRTMLYNINTLEWDEKLLSVFNIPRSMLPEVLPSSGDFGSVNISGVNIPICGVAGDQQAALFGQTCFSAGEAKNTYGTGCFLLMNTGDKRISSQNGLITTIAASAGENVQYALEGSVFVGGAVVQWLRDEMGLISESGDSEYFASKVSDSGGVYVVPAFTGLGAPRWDMYARGSIFGLTRGAGRNHIIRAALESIAYQTADVVRAMESDVGGSITELRADGGASANGFLMQFQADIIGKIVRRPMIRETTALGAAYLAGLCCGVFRDLEDIRRKWTLDRVFEPKMAEIERRRLMRGWERAVERACGWLEE